MIGIALALELYFLGSIQLSSVDNIAISSSLLTVSAFAAALFVFIRGILSYSRELSDKTGYMVFMTPNSTLKIVASKFLYTFVNGLIFAALMGFMGFFDIRLMLGHYGAYDEFLQQMMTMMRMYGIYVDQLIYVLLFYVLFSFLSVLRVVAMAYFAITLSHTLFHDRKGRWAISVLLFLSIYIALERVAAFFPSIREIVDPIQMGFSLPVNAQQQVQVSFWNVIAPSLAPAAGLSIAVILGSMFGCAALIERKISL